MAMDWGEEEPQVCITRSLVSRAFSYFRPYWKRGVLALVAIAVVSALGLVPAFVAKRLIDHLAAPGTPFSYILFLVGLAVAAAILAGLIGVGLAYLDTTISQGIMFDLRRQLFWITPGEKPQSSASPRNGTMGSAVEC